MWPFNKKPEQKREETKDKSKVVKISWCPKCKIKYGEFTKEDMKVYTKMGMHPKCKTVMELR